MWNWQGGMAVKHACDLLNHLPSESTGRSPLETFSRQSYSIKRLQDFHVWGCPVCVLDSTLQDGKKLPRWKSRSARGMHVGNSPTHGHSVPLILNLETGAITHQHHVVFDDWFQTVDSSTSTPINFEHDQWHKTFGLTEWQCISPEHNNLQDTKPPALLPRSPGSVVC